jgi:hypothetical protein
MSLPAKTHALEALVEAHARELHLPAIRQRFRPLAAEATREQQTPLAYLAALLSAQTSRRQHDDHYRIRTTQGLATVELPAGRSNHPASRPLR